MNIEKTITIILVAVALLVLTLCIVINVNFFKEISPVSTEPEEKSARYEEPELNYAIPSAAIPTGQITEIAIDGIIEKRKAMKERELEAGQARAVRRAEAFARQKEAENALLSAASIDSKQTAVVSPAKEEDNLPTDEEIKKMESEGIISY